MKRMLLMSMALFSVFVLLLIAIGTQLDTTWHAEAEETIDAKPDQVYDFISNMENWNSWAAWVDEDDEQIEIKHEGPKQGVGATISWGTDGSSGRLTIVKADPENGIWYEVALENDDVQANGSVTFREVDGKTVVMWEDEGPLPPIIGGYFRAATNEQIMEHLEASLDRLKAKLEKSTPVEVEPDKPAED